MAIINEIDETILEHKTAYCLSKLIVFGVCHFSTPPLNNLDFKNSHLFL